MCVCVKGWGVCVCPCASQPPFQRGANDVLQSVHLDVKSKRGDERGRVFALRRSEVIIWHKELAGWQQMCNNGERACQ